MLPSANSASTALSSGPRPGRKSASSDDTHSSASGFRTSRLQRDRIVGSKPPGAWLTRRNSARGGGSSRILRTALAALEFIRSEEHTSELQSLMRISYAVFCLNKQNKTTCIMKTEKDNLYQTKE